MPSSALLFPGQGSHAEGMDDPYRGHPLFERGRQLGQRGALGGQLRQQGLPFDFGELARGDIGRDADQRFEAAIGPANRARANPAAFGTFDKTSAISAG